MVAIFDLGTYKCTTLPKTLWRVTHSESQSRRDLVTGDFVASDSDRIISDKLSLKQALENHFVWKCLQPSYFLSVFSSESHALRWAKKLEEGIDDVYIDEIDTTKLPAATYVFDAASLATGFGIAYQYATHELIFLHRIPGASLTCTRSLEEIEEQEVEDRRYAARRFNPRNHHVPKLNGWYDSDEECEERNGSDDIINMIEGNW